MNYLIFDIHTQHTCLCSMNAIFICVIVLDQMCFHMLNSCWSNTKRFLSILVVFGKSFVFVKMSKFFKNSVALFWRLSCGLVQSHVLVASPHKDFSLLIGGSIPQSRKILRIFFKIWVFNVSRDSVWRLLCRWKVQSRKGSEIFAAYLATLSLVELPVAKNT